MARIIVATEWGTFTRHTDRRYTHLIIGRRDQKSPYEALGWSTSERNAKRMFEHKSRFFHDVRMIPIPK